MADRWSVTSIAAATRGPRRRVPVALRAEFAGRSQNAVRWKVRFANSQQESWTQARVTGHFPRHFVERCRRAAIRHRAGRWDRYVKPGKLVHVEVGAAASDQPVTTSSHLVVNAGVDQKNLVLLAPTSVASRPVVMYPQNGRDVCVSFSLASALHFSGELGQAVIPSVLAFAVLCHEDNMRAIMLHVINNLKGWRAKSIKGPNFTMERSAHPTILQLSDDDGDRSHSVTAIGRWLFDANQEYAVPFTTAGLDSCCKSGRFGFVVRGVRCIQPQPRVRTGRPAKRQRP